MSEGSVGPMRFALFLLFFSVSAALPQTKTEPSPESARFFEAKVRPVLADHCFVCHGDKGAQSKLKLTALSGLLEGGTRGPAIVPGDPDKSLLIKAIRYDDAQLKMPPGKKLSSKQVADLIQWVKMGAPWPASVPSKTQTPPEKHWSFQPVKRTPLPKVKMQSWVANPIDAFILAKLEAKGLKPNPQANRRELIRRVYYDLIGLPPTPEEVESFVSDKSIGAYERLIDRLLASPQYGEKWGRHWLDLVRYAETNSYERDNPKPNAWRYRDYVIRSFNQDKPYNQFIVEQLAGDELIRVNESMSQWVNGKTPGLPIDSLTHLPIDPLDAVTATGYYRLGIWDDEPTDIVQAKYDGLDDIITTTGQVFLGLTIDCARCHNHKIDPILQKDYYSLLAFFQNINHFRNGGPTDEEPLIREASARQEYDRKVRELNDKRDAVRDAVTAIESDFRAIRAREGGEQKPIDDIAKLIRTDGERLLGKERLEQYKTLSRELEDLRRQKVPADMALCVTESGYRSPETFVLMRGNAHVKGDRVEPGYPQILGFAPPTLPEAPTSSTTCGRRLVLANWIASRENPITSRVIVNRIWQYHFGRGIVRTPNDYGLQGERPTHPELLDWLADTFTSSPQSPKDIGCNWRLKALHRLIMTSNAYRMSSRGDTEKLKSDQENDLFWRFNMRRLTAEEIRDSILMLSGSLNLQMSGPGIYPEIPKEVLAGQSMPGYGWHTSTAAQQNRRSVYIHVKRSLLVPILEAFDVAETDHTTPVRFSTTQPTQALMFINSEFMNKQAAAFAARLRREAGDDVTSQVRLGLQLATSRPPTVKEIERGVKLIEKLRSESVSADVALASFCLLVLNLNEFVYLD